MRIMKKIPSVTLAVAMVASGAASIALAPSVRETFARLGLPLTLAIWLGGWKAAGGIVLLISPRWRRRTLTDWTYAGFFFLLSGAVVLHAAAGDSLAQTVAPVALLVLTVVSYAIEFRTRTVGS